jgi:hypothetical protein
MEELFKWLSVNSIASIVLLILFAGSIVSLLVTYLIAFFQGREISFYPPKLGPRPDESKKGDKSGKNRRSLLSPEDGICAIYVPRTNPERNRWKREAIRAAEGRIQLLATTGHSYLALVGNRFRGDLIDRLNAHVLVQIILLNPWTDSGVFIAFGELPSEPPRQWHRIVQQLRQGKMEGFDPVEFIEDSVYYDQKLRVSLGGYINLRERFGDRIELKVVDREIVATILLTEKNCFIEPYVNVNLQERMRHLMHTFEIEFQQESYLTATCQAYFDTLWRLAVPCDEFRLMEEQLKSRLRERYL